MNRREALHSLAVAPAAFAANLAAPAAPSRPSSHELEARPDNCPLAEKVAEALWPLLDACAAYLDWHDEHECEHSCSVDGDIHDDVFVLHYLCRNLDSFLTGELRMWAAHARRSALEARRAGRLQEARRWDTWAPKKG
jgi:hypothetical protein